MIRHSSTLQIVYQNLHSNSVSSRCQPQQHEQQTVAMPLLKEKTTCLKTKISDNQSLSPDWQILQNILQYEHVQAVVCYEPIETKLIVIDNNSNKQQQQRPST
jgi:hypothetical protein